jgi:hypothetical protein
MAPDGFTGTLHALVSARIPRSGTIPLRADVNATRPRPTGPDGGPGPAWTKADYRAHLQKALGDVLQALDEQAHLVVASNDGLIAALEHGEPDVRVMAARTLGTRQATEAVEPLCAMLKREKNQVGEAAVGALAALRQQKAVPCLIQWAGSDLRRLVVTMEPLSAIGGQEAQAFLEMIASGHDDPRIRRAAEEALRRMGATSKQ